MIKLYPLNTKAIKKAMKNHGIKVIHCYRGKGTTKNATMINIDAADIDKALHFFNEFGIVSCTGTKHFKMKSNGGLYRIGSCYMTEAMYKELNEYQAEY